MHDFLNPKTKTLASIIPQKRRKVSIYADVSREIYRSANPNYSDTGTAWECGYAFATGKPVLVVQLGDSSNLMVHEGFHTNLMAVEDLMEYDFEVMSRNIYTGKMY